MRIDVERYWGPEMKKSLLVIALTLTPIFAHADSWLHFEGDLGESHYTGSGSGTYYEDGARYPHTLNFNRVAFEVGVTGPIFTQPNYGVNWHADYVYLGRESFDGQVNSDDANFSATSKSGCNGECAPTEHMWGGGSVTGISLPIEPYYLYRGVRFSALLGPFIYRPTMSLSFTVPSFTVPSGTTFNFNSPNSIRISLMYGFQVTYKNVFVRYEHFTDRSAGGVSNPGIQTSTDLLSLGYTF